MKERKRKNRFLAISKRSIPYIKEGRKFAGSVTSTILWQQLEYWFDRNPEGFYKFLEKCEHALYKEGDSWCEEIGFSPDEFRNAFFKIGVKYLSVSEYQKAVDSDSVFFDEKGVEKMYASYYDKIKRTTHYLRNDYLVDLNLDTMIWGGDTDTTSTIPYGGGDSTLPMAISPNRQTQSRQTDNGNPEYTESTSESIDKDDIIFSLPNLNSLETDASVREAFESSEEWLKTQRRLILTKSKEQDFDIMCVNLPTFKPIFIVSDATIGKLSFEQIKSLISPLNRFENNEMFHAYYRKLDERLFELGMEITNKLGIVEAVPPSEDQKEYFKL